MARHYPRPAFTQDQGSVAPILYIAGTALFIWWLVSSAPKPSEATNDQQKSPGGRPSAYRHQRPPTFNASDPYDNWEQSSSTSRSIQANSQSVPAESSQYPPFSAAKYAKDGNYHLLLCATGSVATIKIPSICNDLSKYSNLSICVILSDSALQFLQGQSAEQPHWTTLKQIRNVEWVYIDSSEWKRPWKRGDDILHIELRRWADLMVIAPLSANALAKMALGFSDNLILSVARAWDTTGQIDGVRPDVPLTGGAKKTIMVAPAMNMAMYAHPATAKHTKVLSDDWGVQNGGWIELLSPVQKGLACGDVGNGAMREWKAIVGDIERKFPKLRTDTASASAEGR